ncbi:hypothetical protein ABPG75_011864, partial [Micractinium tetrahymenae]
MNPGGGGGGSGEVAQPARSRAVGARLSKVEANALSVAFRLPADLADENVKLLRSGHPTKMPIGDLSTLNQFLIDVTDMEMHAVKIATFGGEDYYSHMLKRPLEGLKPYATWEALVLRERHMHESAQSMKEARLRFQTLATLHFPEFNWRTIKFYRMYLFEQAAIRIASARYTNTDTQLGI